MLAQEQFPTAVVDLGVPGESTEDLPEEVEGEDERSGEIFLEEGLGVEVGATDGLN